MRHPRRAPRRSRSFAAAAPLLLVTLLVPAAALADRETPRAASRDRGPEARSSAPAPAPSQPAVRGPERGSTGGGSAGRSVGRVPDDRRGDRRERAESRFRGGGRFYYYPRPYYGGWYGGFWASLLFDYYGYPWAYHGPGPGYRDYRYRDAGGDWGALDLDVSPAKTEVYLDGQYLGRVDSFDGFPQYLWLEEGTYDLVLFKEGYRTIARQVTVLPGVVIAVDHSLEPGDSVRPEDLAAKTHERRDRRLRYDREARERAEAIEGDDDDDNEAEAEEEELEAEDESERRDGRRRERGRADVGRVRLEVEPDDASVYLDGRFIGTGAEIGRLHSGLILDRGAHRISVVRPGYRPRELEFDVREGEELELEIDLEPGT